MHKSTLKPLSPAQNETPDMTSASIVAGICRIEPVLRRWPRVLQSRLADRAEALGRSELKVTTDGVEVQLSRSHSRGYSAAALGKGDFRLGIDVELEDPRRDWPGIVSRYAPDLIAVDIDAETGARCWTFLEAFYKAEGRVPPAGMIERVASTPDQALVVLDKSSSAFASFTRLPDGFALCVYARDTGIAAPLILPVQPVDNV